MNYIQELPTLRLCVIQNKPATFGSRRLHSHPFHEVGFVLRGDCQWNQEKRRPISLSTGQAVWISPEHLHREESSDSVQLAWIGFTLKNDIPVKALRPISVAENLETIVFLLRQIEREQHGTEPDSPAICSLALQHILILLGRAGLRKASAKLPAGSLRPRQIQIVRSVAAHLDQNRNRPLSLEQVAQYHNLSAPHLSILFQKHYRMTPTAYRLHGRLAHAKELMEDPKRSVKEIAAACGFTDSAHFCREFKRLTGKSPGLWR